MGDSDQVIEVLGIVGSGAMGAGIAQVALIAQLTVILYDTQPAALSAARDQIHRRLIRLVEKRSLGPAAVEVCMSRLRLANTVEDLVPARVILEAVVERLETKQELFSSLEAVVPKSTILATNTSSLSVTAIALACKRRDRICGLHFFNPVPVMKLAEVVSGAETSALTLQVCSRLAERLGKTPVRVKDVPGFLVNLLGRAYTTEALQLDQERVAPIETIDRIMREAAGFPMGPFELLDLTGIDVNFPAATRIYEAFQHDPRLKTTIRHQSLYVAGHLGRKTGRGFYQYNEAAAPESKASAPLPPTSRNAIPVVIPLPDAGLDHLAKSGCIEALVGDSADQANIDILIAPIGEDAASMATRLRLDPSRVVAIDCLGLHRRFLTLMSPLGARSRADLMALQLQAQGYQTAVIADSPAFVAPRILAMVANLGCEVAQAGIGSPRDIDMAMKLAQNYPKGPLEWAEAIGLRRTLQTLQELQNLTGSDRYRPSTWLRQRAQLGMHVYCDE